MASRSRLASIQRAAPGGRTPVPDEPGMTHVPTKWRHLLVGRIKGNAMCDQRGDSILHIRAVVDIPQK